MAEDMQGLGRLLGRIHALATDTRHIERPLNAAGVYMLGSIEQNFRAQGRPARWQKLAPSTLARRRRGRGRGRAQILIDTARMKNSIGRRVHTGYVEVGLNARQAKRMQFGFPGGTGPGHAETPARPFLLLQGEDFAGLADIFRRHVER